MVTFVFSKFAHKKFRGLGPSIQDRIIEKLKELKTHPEILSTLKPLHNFKPATHRLRVDDYRLILQLTSHIGTRYEFLVLDIGHRRDIYQ